MVFSLQEYDGAYAEKNKDLSWWATHQLYTLNHNHEEWKEAHWVKPLVSRVIKVYTELGSKSKNRSGIKTYLTATNV